MEGGVSKGTFLRCVTLNAQKRWPGLADGQDKSFSKEVIFLGRDHPL